MNPLEDTRHHRNMEIANDMRQREINTAIGWMDDLLVRYKKALSLLGKSEAQIGLATFPHRTAIENLQKLKSK